MTILDIDEEAITAESFWQQDIEDIEGIEDDIEEKDPRIDIEDRIQIIREEKKNEESSVVEKMKKSGQFLFGLFLAFLSGFIFTCNNMVIQKYNLDYADTIAVRGLVQVVVIGLFVFMSKLSLWPKADERPNRLRALMVLQGVLGGVMIICTYCSLQFLPLGDALTLIFSAPLSTMVLAAVFLRQPLKLFKITCGLLLLTGTILVVRPPFIIHQKDSQDIIPENITGIFISLYADVNISQIRPQPIIHQNHYYIGVAIALTSTIINGFLNITISACTSIHTLVLLWWAGVGSLFVGCIAYAFDHEAILFTQNIVEITLDDWLALFGIASTGILAYFCMTRALHLIDPTIVSFSRASEIVFAYVLQVVVMHQMPAILSVIGATLVLVSVLAMAAQDKIVKCLPQRIRFLF